MAESVAELTAEGELRRLRLLANLYVALSIAGSIGATVLAAFAFSYSVDF